MIMFNKDMIIHSRDVPHRRVLLDGMPIFNSSWYSEQEEFPLVNAEVWQQKPEPELTTHEACEQLYYAAEKFYDTVLREDWSMRDANKGALDILREVASWKNPQKEQENAR